MKKGIDSKDVGTTKEMTAKKKESVTTYVFPSLKVRVQARNYNEALDKARKLVTKVK